MKRKGILIGAGVLGLLTCVVIWGLAALSIARNPAVSQALQKTSEQLSALPPLQADLLKNCDCERVSVQVMNGHVLQVALVNTRYYDLSDPERGDRARSVAVFVAGDYKDMQTIDVIAIDLSRSVSAGLTLTQSVGYVFNVDELK
jgi:hypothetical protein